MQGLEQLVERLSETKDALHGCESLSVASSDGLILATTHEERRRGDQLAALSSFLLSSSAKGLESYRAGRCRALDYRGDRQILIIRLDAVDAFLACVLHPGAQAVNLDDPVLRAVIASIPGALHGETVSTRRFFLERDKYLRITVTHGGVLLGTDPGCDLVLVSDRVESRHVLVELVRDTVLVTDLDTRHGTKVNGKKISGNAELAPGDRLSLPGARGFTLLAIDDDGAFVGKSKGKKQKSKSR